MNQNINLTSDFPPLSLSTINCNSLNDSSIGTMSHKVKLYGITKLGSDIIFLSDIRLCNSRGISSNAPLHDTFRINPYNSYKFFHQSRSNKRGVGILIKQNLNINILQEFREDASDDILGLRCEYQGKEFALLAIYGPNVHQPIFFNFIRNSITAMNNVPIVIAGDWNCTMSSLNVHNNPDCLNMNALPNKRHTELLIELCTDTGLVDPYRARYPNRKEFTYIPSDLVKKNRSRIDFFLISKTILPLVEDVFINQCLQSKMFDHKAVHLSFKKRRGVISRPTISHAVLQDPDLDMVVGLAVLDTYLTSSNPRDDINLDNVKISLGNNMQLLRDIGPADKFLEPGARSEQESLIREGNITRIRDFLESALM